jgi:hypothetical protein
MWLRGLKYCLRKPEATGLNIENLKAFSENLKKLMSKHNFKVALSCLHCCPMHYNHWIALLLVHVKNIIMLALMIGCPLIKIFLLKMRRHVKSWILTDKPEKSATENQRAKKGKRNIQGKHLTRKL